MNNPIRNLGQPDPPQGQPVLIDPEYLRALEVHYERTSLGAQGTSSTAGTSTSTAAAPNVVPTPAPVAFTSASATRGPSLAGPPQVYRGGIDDGNLVGNRYARGLLDNCGGQIHAYQEEWRRLSKDVISDAAEEKLYTSQRAKQDRQMLQYQTFAHREHPEEDIPNLWRADIFFALVKQYLLSLVMVSEGRSGPNRDKIRSSTLGQWTENLIAVARRKLIDKDGNKVGEQMITKDFRIEMSEHILWLTEKYGLERRPLIQSMIGRSELLLMFRAGFRDSETSGRDCFIQLWVATLIVFHTGCRIGSLGYSNMEYKRLGRYIRNEDIKLQKEGPCQWTAIVNILNRKGYNMALDAGKPLQYRIESVTKMHNLWFDLPLALVVLGLSINDAVAYDGVEFQYEDDMKQAPLLVARANGGSALAPHRGPAPAAGLTQSLIALGAKIGVENATNQAVRRDAGNGVGMAAGAEIAQAFLGHQEADTTYSLHYTRGTANLSLTGIRTGEAKLDVPEIYNMGMRLHTHSEKAARALIWAGDLPEHEVLTLSAEDEERALADPIIVALDKESDKLWDELFALLPDEVRKDYSGRLKQSITKMFGKYANSEQYKKNKDRLHELHDELVTLGEERAGELRRARRPFLTKMRLEALRKKSETLTQTELRDALREMDELRNSDENVPRFKPSSTLSRLNVDYRNVNFGAGILTTACRELFAKPDFIESLREEERSQVALLEEKVKLKPTNKAPATTTGSNDPSGSKPAAPNRKRARRERDEAQFHDVHTAAFSDKEEVQVLEANEQEFKISFMEAMLRPLIELETRKALSKRSETEWVCLICEILPESMRPKAFAGNQAISFSSQQHLIRHEETHSEWMKKVLLMPTDAAGVFRCTTQGCEFRTGSIQGVQNHLLADCKEKDYYNRLKYLHDHPPSKAEDRSHLRGQVIDELMPSTGIPTNDGELEAAVCLLEMDDEEILEISRRHNRWHEGLLSDIQDARGFTKLVRPHWPADGTVLRDPLPRGTLEANLGRVFTLEARAEILADLNKVSVDNNTRLDVHWEDEEPELIGDPHEEEMRKLKEWYDKHDPHQ